LCLHFEKTEFRFKAWSCFPFLTQRFLESAPPAAISSVTVTPTSPATSRVQNPPYELANSTETPIVLNGPDPMIQSTIP
jgi:hypothetical protein